MIRSRPIVASLALMFVLSLALPWAAAETRIEERTAVAQVSAGTDAVAGGLTIDPSWIPFILASTPAGFVVEVVEGVPSLVVEATELCAPDASPPPVGSCEEGVFVVPLNGPLTPEDYAFIVGLGFKDELPADLFPTVVASSGGGYRRECWYYDTNHYRCCDYYESGMVYCYDYYYECRSSGRYNRYCGWSKHQTYHKCTTS